MLPPAPPDPGLCALFGFCPAPVAEGGLPSGVMFVALGLVMAGVRWWRMQRRALGA